MNIIVASGYFNPIHKGHIEYLNNSKENGDELFVIVNSDIQRELKGSKEFQEQSERCFIVDSIKSVDRVILSIDSDRTVCKTLEYIHDMYGDGNKIYFTNGGDQDNQSIPEVSVCKRLGIGLIDGLGNKIQSSSWLLNKK